MGYFNHGLLTLRTGHTVWLWDFIHWEYTPQQPCYTFVKSMPRISRQKEAFMVYSMLLTTETESWASSILYSCPFAVALFFDWWIDLNTILLRHWCQNYENKWSPRVWATRPLGYPPFCMPGPEYHYTVKNAFAAREFSLLYQRLFPAISGEKFLTWYTGEFYPH